MKAENKYSLMVWAIIVLAIMNVSTIATILYHQYESRKKIEITSGSQKQLEADSEKYSGRYFRDQLELSSDQMDKFREINPAFRFQARTVTVSLAEMRKQMLAEMAAANSDTTKLNVISDSIGKLHSKLKKLTFNYYLELKGICNPEQRKKLEKIFADIFTNDATMSYPGRGMGKGKHRGAMNGREAN